MRHLEQMTSELYTKVIRSVDTICSHTPYWCTHSRII